MLLEQPASSAALRLPVLQKRRVVYQAHVHQCMDGLKDPVSGLWYQKHTILEVNDADFARRLELVSDFLVFG